MTSDLYRVKLSKKASKDLKKVPVYIATKLQTWIHAVGCYGLREVRKIKGYHDELLKGKRAGQHSIRLNKAYRAIYIIEHDEVYFVEIIEVTKHAY